MKAGALLLAVALSSRALAQQNPPADQPDSARQPSPASQPPGGVQPPPPPQPGPALAPAQSAPPVRAAQEPRLRAAQDVRVVADAGGLKLRVDGRDTMIYGMNWDYVPIGQNYAYSLWTQPDDLIIAALGKEMPLLKRMGVNAIRQYAGIPPRWVQYIFEKYGIYTVLNHTAGRYGLTLNGVWIPQVDYSDAVIRKAITDEVGALVEQYRDTPGILFWLLGNENNYGLHWASREIEALPEGKRDEARARQLYSLFGELIKGVKARDPHHPVAIANGDVQYLDLIAEECKGLDLFGANVYRGASARDLFQVVHDKLGIPVVFTEFGSDAYDAKLMREDDVMQARYLRAQWEEIYEQSAGKGRVGNAIGGFVFQWSDGWWKFGQETRLDIHDTNASWPDAAYADDYVEGQNNMNEEWWGICAKGPPDARGLFDLYPRTAYYVLQEAFALPAYAPGTDLARIRAWFDRIEPAALAHFYRADTASRSVSLLEVARVSGLRLSFETYYVGGTNVTTPAAAKGFDHMESFYGTFEAHPTDRVTGSLSLNVLGNVAQKPIDQIFYEKRGQPVQLTDASGKPYTLQGNERVKVYNASINWDDDDFSLLAYHRIGHYHWGYEGDFFGLYREANYGPSTDIYDADVPSGVEVTGKRVFEGLKLAFGPQIWWGANPQVMVKYQHQFGSISAAAIYADEFATQAGTATSTAVPTKPTRKATLWLARDVYGFQVQLGGIWSGSTLVGDSFQNVNTARNVTYADHIVATDTLGAKAKVSLETGRWHAYAEAAYMGLVANGGPTSALTFTGWSLTDSGSGDQANFLTGVAVNVGPFQIAPNFLWQQPLVGPVAATAGRPRNVLDDPFVVRANRQTVAGELMIIYDPTPATWMFAWDSDLREDAPFAASLDLSYRYQSTTQDSGVGINADGTLFAFNGAPPPHNLFEARARVVGSPIPSIRLVGHAYAGQAESTGSDGRLLTRFGADGRVSWRSAAFSGFVKVNDWGPYDYHRDYNLTFPLQLTGDLSYALGAPRWLGLSQTRFGFRGTLRYLDRFSPRFAADPQHPTNPGSEYELRSYLLFTL